MTFTLVTMHRATTAVTARCYPPCCSASTHRLATRPSATSAQLSSPASSVGLQDTHMIANAWVARRMLLVLNMRLNSEYGTDARSKEAWSCTRYMCLVAGKCRAAHMCVVAHVCSSHVVHTLGCHPQQCLQPTSHHQSRAVEQTPQM